MNMGIDLLSHLEHLNISQQDLLSFSKSIPNVHFELVFNILSGKQRYLHIAPNNKSRRNKEPHLCTLQITHH